MFSFYSTNDKTLTKEKLLADIKVLQDRIDSLETTVNNLNLDICRINEKHVKDLENLHNELQDLSNLLINNARTRNMIIRSYSTKSGLVSKFIPDE